MVLHPRTIHVKFLLQGNLLMHSASMNGYGNKACINDKFHIFFCTEKKKMQYSENKKYGKHEENLISVLSGTLEITSALGCANN